MTDLDEWRRKYDHWRLSGPPDDSDREGQRTREDYETDKADDHYHDRRTNDESDD